MFPQTMHIATLCMTAVLLTALGACKAPAPKTKLANPASENCISHGGTHTTGRSPKGGEFGVCLFEDNRQCEEWALLLGHCPVGGVKVAGYATQAARFCGITGGQYTATANSGAADEQGSCTLPDGTSCDAQAYFGGECTRK